MQSRLPVSVHWQQPHVLQAAGSAFSSVGPQRTLTSSAEASWGPRNGKGYSRPWAAVLSSCSVLLSTVLSPRSRRGPSLRRHTRRQAQVWSDMNCGTGVEVLHDGKVVRRLNFTEKPEGYCVAVTAQPMQVEDGPRGRTHYAEVKIENDCPTFGGGMELGFTSLSPEEIGAAACEDLRWAELENTWVFREDGAFRFGGRPYPRDAMPGTGLSMDGFDSRRLEFGDTLGLRVEKTAVVTFVNGRPVGRMELDEAEVEAPVDGDLYFLADVVGKAAELELLDAEMPK